ncbi:hypothetical protein SDC9_204430 [bioreactor metagenome]|uniref:Uncharacterized protein n=1 Tax=bioreactor metagenome TaxID=1076179 RepID=A0A645IZ86_9ZZZZ
MLRIDAIAIDEFRLDGSLFTVDGDDRIDRFEIVVYPGIPVRAEYCDGFKAGKAGSTVVPFKRAVDIPAGVKGGFAAVFQLVAKVVFLGVEHHGTVSHRVASHADRTAGRNVLVYPFCGFEPGIAFGGGFLIPCHCVCKFQ